MSSQIDNNQNRQHQNYAFVIQSELLFFWIFLIIIFSWILIDLYGRWLNNFTFVTLGLDEKSPWQTFIIAITVTAIIFTCIIFLKNIGYNMEPEVCALCNNQNYPPVPIPDPLVFFGHV
jgi:low affinity Fe/Cu permease